MRILDKIFKRASYSDQYANLLYQTYSGEITPAGESVCETIPASYIARALAGARIGGEGPYAFDSDFLYRLGISLVLRGESLWHVNIEPDGVELHEAISWQWHGGVSPRSWVAEAQFHTPSGGDFVKQLRWDSVLFFTWSSAPGKPFMGTSPLARNTRDLAKQIEAKWLRSASESPGGGVYTVPSVFAEGEEAKKLAELMKSLRGGKGLVPVGAEWNEKNYGLPGAGAPLLSASNIFKELDLRFNPGNEATALWSKLLDTLLVSCGLSIEMLTRATGSELQLEERRFLATTLRPLAMRIEREIQNKTTRPVTLTFPLLSGMDLQTKSKAITELTKDGLYSKPEAEAIAGIER